MNRTLSRRVVAAKEHFAGEINTCKMQEERARNELRQTEIREMELREKYNELLSSSKTQVERLTNRLEEIQEANATLQRTNERARSDVETTLHEQLEAQRMKQTRLESEHRLLKKESCKMEVLTRTMQRDVQRLQALYNAEAKSRQQLEEISVGRQEAADLLTSENDALKESIRLLMLENEELKQRNAARAMQPPQPSSSGGEMKESAIEDIAATPIHSVDETAVGVSRVDYPAGNARGTIGRSGADNVSQSVGASGIAIDAVMQKLRDWTDKLSELDNTPY